MGSERGTGGTGTQDAAACRLMPRTPPVNTLTDRSIGNIVEVLQELQNTS